MARPKHPNKEIEAALLYAETHGWTVEKASGSAHCWGQLRCPANNSGCWQGLYCQQSVWSTPKNPANHARLLKRIVDKCQFLGDENE